MVAVPALAPLVIIALLWSLLRVLALGFAGDRALRILEQLPLSFRMVFPCVFGVPYFLVAHSFSALRAQWGALYLALPVLVALLLWQARIRDPQQQGSWLDVMVLLTLGLAVDLRWLEPAWPGQLRCLGMVVLVVAGLHGFLM